MQCSKHRRKDCTEPSCTWKKGSGCRRANREAGDLPVEGVSAAAQAVGARRRSKTPRRRAASAPQRNEAASASDAPLQAARLAERSESPEEERVRLPPTARYASAHRLGQALNNHCLKREALAPDVHQCMMEMFKTDQADRSLKARLARRLSSYTTDKTQICSHDICDLERLQGQRAILDLGEAQRHRLFVPDVARCSDAKLAHLKSVDRCHKSLTLAATEVAVMTALSGLNRARGFAKVGVRVANFLFPWRHSLDVFPALNVIVSTLAFHNVFGKALGLFGLTLVPALTSVLMLLPVWSMPNCKKGHYSADGWVMLFSSTLSGLIFFWVGSLVAATTTFATGLVDSNDNVIVDGLRKLGLVPVALVDKVGKILSKALIQSAGLAEKTERMSAATTALFATYASYLFSGLPAVIGDLLGGIGQALVQASKSVLLPTQLAELWEMGLTEYVGDITFEAWSHVMLHLKHAFKRWDGLQNYRLKYVFDFGSDLMQNMFIGRSGLDVELESMWANAGLVVQNVSVMMLKAKDWATCIMALELAQVLRERSLRRLKKTRE